MAFLSNRHKFQFIKGFPNKSGIYTVKTCYGRIRTGYYDADNQEWMNISNDIYHSFSPKSYTQFSDEQRRELLEYQMKKLFA